MTHIDTMKMALEALEQIKQDTFHPAKVFAYNPAITALRQAIKQAQEQEPVARLSWHPNQGYVVAMEDAGRALPEGEYALYTTPPRREWVGLTDEEVLRVNNLGWDKGNDDDIIAAPDAELLEFARAIEAKLKEKNT